MRKGVEFTRKQNKRTPVTSAVQKQIRVPAGVASHWLALHSGRAEWAHKPGHAKPHYFMLFHCKSQGPPSPSKPYLCLETNSSAVSKLLPAFPPPPLWRSTY